MAGPKVPLGTLLRGGNVNNPAYGYPVGTRGASIEGGPGEMRLPGQGGDEFPWGTEGMFDRAKRIQAATALKAIFDAMAAQQMQESGVGAPEGIAGMLVQNYPEIPNAEGPKIPPKEGKIKMPGRHAAEHPEIGLLTRILGGYGE